MVNNREQLAHHAANHVKREIGSTLNAFNSFGQAVTGALAETFGEKHPSFTDRVLISVGLKEEPKPGFFTRVGQMFQ